LMPRRRKLRTGTSGIGISPLIKYRTTRAPPITLCAGVDPDLGQAFNEYVDSLRPKTTTHAVIEMLIERYLTESGMWPSAQPPSE